MLARFAYGATALAALVLIFGGRFVPLQDYADWVFQADLFARLLRGELPSEVAFVGALAPNALCTLVMGMLALVMPVELAGKLFLIGSVLSFLWAGDRLSRARAGGGPLAFITPIFALNYSFFHGNINYAFGLALLLASAAYLIRREDAAKPGALALFSIALYFAHGAVLVAWAVLLAAFALSRASSGRARTAALGFAPVLPLGIAYVALQGSGGSAITYADAGGFHWLSFLDLKASTFTRMLALFHGFHPLYAGIAALVLPLAVGNFVFLALLVYALRTAPGRVVRERLWFGYAAAALFLLCLLAPRESGGLVNPGERLVLPGVFLLSLCVQPEKRPQPLRNALFAALLGSLAFLLFHGRQAQAALSRFHAALERALREGWIAGAGIDVFPEEPPPADDPLFSLPNVIVTPHALAWTNGIMRGNGDAACQHILSVMQGRAPGDVVNREVLNDPRFLAKLERYR